MADVAATTSGSNKMYGLISQFITKPEDREEFIEILSEATRGMAGCLSYVIAIDILRNDAIWITEVWKDSESHAASLKLPGIQAAMTKGRPLITALGLRTTTRPVSGV